MDRVYRLVVSVGWLFIGWGAGRCGRTGSGRRVGSERYPRMIPVTAQVKAGIDLSKLKDVRMEGEDIYLTLPAPFIEIESSEIRHDEVQTSVGLLRSNFTQDEFSQFANRGRRSIEQALPGMGLVEQCQEQARTMLSLMIRKLGKNPVIEVPKYNTEEVEKMIIYKDKQK